MNTKLSAVTAALEAGDFRRAIALAAKFPRLGAERNAILDAHGAYTYPHFAAQLGKDIEQLKLLGIAALRARYSGKAVL